MQLLTEEVRKKLPPLYSQENVTDPVVICKFFYPDFSWTWYAIEGSPVDEDGYYDTDKDKVDFVFFGLVVGLEVALGYFSLSELMNNRGKLGCSIERDLYFTPKPLSEVQKLHNGAR
jgi:hypothetical protein